MVKHSLTRFAACISIALYLALLFAEYLRPGFVSTVMNVHVMWLAMVPLVLTSDIHTSRDTSVVKRGVSRLGLVLIGIVLALIVWHLGEVFGGMRFWFAIAAGFAPLALFRYPR